jgi:hypothetical protein
VISVLLYDRNDAHGYTLQRRAAMSLNCLAEVVTDPDDEIIFVDYTRPTSCRSRVGWGTTSGSWESTFAR